jgi:hypothetical protein
MEVNHEYNVQIMYEYCAVSMRHCMGIDRICYWRLCTEIEQLLV